jgi:hypothetical protein
MGMFDEPDIYHGILESLSTGLCVIDLQKRIVLWSEGAERMTDASGTRSSAIPVSVSRCCTAITKTANGATRIALSRAP